LNVEFIIITPGLLVSDRGCVGDGAFDIGFIPCFAQTIPKFGGGVEDIATPMSLSFLIHKPPFAHMPLKLRGEPSSGSSLYLKPNKTTLIVKKNLTSEL